MKQPWYSKKWVVITLHIAAWVLLFSLPFLLHPSSDDNKAHHSSEDNDANSIIKYILTDLLWIGFFYLNAFVLIPQFIYKKKYWSYTLIQIAIIIILVVSDFILVELLRKNGLSIKAHHSICHFSLPFYSCCQYCVSNDKRQDQGRPVDERKRE